MRRPIFSTAFWLLLAAAAHTACGQTLILGPTTGRSQSDVQLPSTPPLSARFPTGTIASRANPPADTPPGDTAPAGNLDPQNGSGQVIYHHGPGHHHLHHGHGVGNRGGVFGSVGYPWGWGTPYLPAIYAYYPSVPVFGYGLSVPAASFSTAPIVVPQNVVAPRNNVAANAPARVPAIPDVPPTPRTSNQEQRARAGRYLGFGDSQFAKQKYLAALGRYKTAVETAPDMAEGYLRQAFSYVAMGQYESAAKAFKRGLQVRGDWRGTPLRLDDLYADAQISKTQHLEELAKAIEINPFDSNLLLAMGLELYFDGQPERAKVFLSRVAQFGGDEKLLEKFLQQPKPAGAPDPPRERKSRVLDATEDYAASRSASSLLTALFFQVSVQRQPAQEKPTPNPASRHFVPRRNRPLDRNSCIMMGIVDDTVLP